MGHLVGGFVGPVVLRAAMRSDRARSRSGRAARRSRAEAGPRSFAELAAGFRLPWVGARLLLRERRLWAPALVPLLLSFGAFALAASALVAFAGPLHRQLTAWMPSPVASDWLSWLWVGPAQLG